MFDKMVREGNFNKALYLKIDDNFELLGKTVLIVGFGRIGRKLIKKCLGFDMNVIVFDPNVHGDEIKSFILAMVNNSVAGVAPPSAITGSPISTSRAKI